MSASVAIGERTVFFIAGCQKSGTTWVQRLLDAHPSICCRGEGHLSDIVGPMLEQAVRLYNENERTNWKLDQHHAFSITRLISDQVFQKYLSTRENPDIVTAIGDKTPEAALGIMPLSTLYPGARFVHVIRDGRDAAVSGWAQLRRLGKDGEFATFADYAEYFARHHWTAYITRAKAAARNLPDRYLELRYESLHVEPFAQTRRVLEFLGVDAADELVNDCVDAASFDRLSGGRRRGQENPASHFRKGIVGDWTSHFDEEALTRFESVAGALLAELGYSAAPTRLTPPPPVGHTRERPVSRRQDARP